MSSSANEKGRTIWEIITGRNKRDMTPLELQYHNPIGAKVGCIVTIDEIPEHTGINFTIERIAVYQTEIGKRKFHHTDYLLKGVTLDIEKPVRLRLRLISDEDATNELGCKIQLLYLYHEEGYNQDLFNYICNPEVFDKDGTVCDIAFCVQQDDDGEELEESRMYWRVGADIEGRLDPYHAKQTTLVDDNGDGKIDDDELEHREVTYWDFSRLTDDPELGVEIVEYLWIEMDDEEGYFTMFRGNDIEPSQLMVY